MSKPERKSMSFPEFEIRQYDIINRDDPNIIEQLRKLLSNGKKYTYIDIDYCDIILVYKIDNPNHSKEMDAYHKNDKDYKEALAVWEKSDEGIKERLAKLYDSEKEILDAMLKKRGY